MPGMHDVDLSVLDYAHRVNRIKDELGLRWDDLRFPAAGLDPVGLTSPATRDADNAGALLFGGTADNVIGVIAQIPHSWLEGSPISPHIHWQPSTADAGNVYWRMEYKIVPLNGVSPGSWTTDNKLAVAGGVANTHKITAFDPIDMTGQKISCMVLIQLTRPALTEATDTYDSHDARLLEFDIHFLQDSMGSRQEYLK